MDEIEFRSIEDVANQSHILIGRLGGRECSARIARVGMINHGIDCVRWARGVITRTLLRDRAMQCVFEIHIDDRESRVRITARRAAPLNYQYGRVEQWLDGPLDAASIENAKCVLRQRLEEATRNQEPPPEVVHWWSQPVDRGYTQPSQYGPDAIQATEWGQVIERNQQRDWFAETWGAMRRYITPASWQDPPETTVAERVPGGFHTDLGTGYGVYYDAGAAATINDIRMAMQENRDASADDTGRTDEERAYRARAREAAGE